ncbi:hypothetical protein H1V43_07135 [Streptomyces sp. PSKA54]|uniref:CopG family transcriptional regulator n=1 Tax=Streptomyces himalayensis subsp. aureolus TaxID=2758039 RepID=A0A7W2CY12_9ACTN|nr:hypothetical protein [Streptomyces himalayensis]MBA4861159.1 hypothetical protein [Streptomyces himalayensis subsp. aureolus]
MDSPEQYGKDEGPAQKVSVSMPAGRIAAVKARVGARGFSAYVSAAVERQIQRDLLEELLQAKEAEIGPPSPGIQEWAEEIFREAETMAANERAAEEREGDGDPEWRGHKAS